MSVQLTLNLWNCKFCGFPASDTVFDGEDWVYSCGCFERKFIETGEHL